MIDLVGLGFPTFLIQDCEAVLVQIGVFRGSNGTVGCASEALVVSASIVVPTQSIARGGAGADDPITGEDDLVAVRLDAGATVTPAHVNAFGGVGGAGTTPGQPALFAVSGAGLLTLSGTAFAPPQVDPSLQLVLPDPRLMGLVASFQAFTSQMSAIPWRASNPVHIVVE